MPVDIVAPSWWEWTLFIPSLAALLAILLLGLRTEVLGPTTGRWGAMDLIAVILIHILAQAGAAEAFKIPFLPASWAIGGGLILADSITCLAVLAIGRTSGGSWEILGLRPPRRSRNGIATAAAYLAFLIPLGLVVWIWIRLLASLGEAPTLQSALRFWIEARLQGDWVGALLLGIGAGVAAPVVEELLFRGFIFGVLRSRLGAATAVVSSSALWALIHIQPEVIVPIFLVGIVLNVIYLRTGCLAYPILFHALFNGGTLLLSGGG